MTTFKVNIAKAIGIICLIISIWLSISISTRKNSDENSVKVLHLSEALVVIGGVLLFFGTRKRGNSEQNQLSEKFLKSKSGFYWKLPRKFNSNDSRDLLEKFGFRILGEIDDVLYMVEPPLGWVIKDWNKETNLYFKIIYDQNGVERFKTFCKKDNVDYKAHILFAEVEA